MAWVRIDDAAMTHPKVVGLSDKAFRLWVWGLTYAQQHLTDGLIVAAAIPSRLARSATDLIGQRLWEVHDIGFKIHDYLDWNDSREVVESRKDGARNRLHQHRLKRVSDQTSETPLARLGLVKDLVLEKRPSAGMRQIEPVPAEDVLVVRAYELLDRYKTLFYEHCSGARYMDRVHLDHDKAMEIVRTWPDDVRLDKLAVLVLTTDDEWIARTDRGFGIFALKVSWADLRLAEWEKKQKATA